MRRNLLYVSSIGEDCCAAAQDFHVGIELAQFCTAARLDGAPAEPWEIPVERCLSAADRFILHGPFNELTPAAIDPLVLDVTKTIPAGNRAGADTRNPKSCSARRLSAAGLLPGMVHRPQRRRMAGTALRDPG